MGGLCRAGARGYPTLRVPSARATTSTLRTPLLRGPAGYRVDVRPPESGWTPFSDRPTRGRPRQPHHRRYCVREVWSAKTRRQLIFASHNANLVVNGDAELIVCCDYRTAGDQSGGTIKVQGAIGMTVRNGDRFSDGGGREAFSPRREVMDSTDDSMLSRRQRRDGSAPSRCQRDCLLALSNEALQRKMRAQ